jgi:hypothetical protein
MQRGPRNARARGPWPQALEAALMGNKVLRPIAGTEWKEVRHHTGVQNDAKSLHAATSAHAPARNAVHSLRGCLRRLETHRGVRGAGD